MTSSAVQETAAPRWATTWWTSHRGTLVVLALATTAGLVRLPFLTRPLGPDEGGLLMVAGQWHPGTSLYGDYWVDRPPVLIDVFALAGHLGGLVGLRLLGVVLVVASVLLAGRAGRLVGATDATAVVAAATAALLLSNPLLGVLEVNGELVATPAVLGAVCAALTAARAGSSARARWLVAAGGLGALAVMVKQNEIDALVLLAVGALTFLAHDRTRRRTTLLLAGAGALAVTGVVLAQAAALGTSPTALWDALVTFRLQASQVIGTSAPPAATSRAPRLLLHLLASGAPLLLLAAVQHLPLRPRPGALDVRWAILAVLSWETVSVVLGGSWWPHYLICLVPGLVLLVAQLAATDPGPRSAGAWSLRSALAVVAVSSLGVLASYAVVPALDPSPAPVVTWLREHAAPGETGVVVLGHPEYLAATGLRSPYPELWSLPVRVRDPHLSRLTAVLDGPDRPDWVVTGPGGRIGGWGIDAPDAQTVFEAHYRLVADVGDRLVFQVR